MNLLDLINPLNTKPLEWEKLSIILNIMKDCPGTYLAGGSLRRLISGEGFDGKEDFDLFFKDEESINLFWAQNESVLETVYETDKNTSVIYRPPDKEYSLRIQVIHFLYYQSLEEIINSFDFTVCQFATDGQEIVCGKTSLDDLLHKRLVVNRITYPTSSIFRLAKYMQSGYGVTHLEIHSILLSNAVGELIRLGEAFKGTGNGPSSA